MGPDFPRQWSDSSMIRKYISLVVVVECLCLALSIGQRAYAQAKPTKVVVLNFDPILRSKGGVRLHEQMKWGDPHAMTRDIVKYLHESSGGFANYEVVEFLDIDSWP